jgi:antitoxin CcdA
MSATIRASRRATNLTIDVELLEEARSLKVNISRAAESCFASAVKPEKGWRWKAENQEEFNSWNDYVGEHGLPLAKHRQF